jgi:hypothetical protein
MKNTRKAAVVFTLALAVAAPAAFAATSKQPSAEGRREDRENRIDRLLERVKHLIVHVLEGPMIPPPEAPKP